MLMLKFESFDFNGIATSKTVALALLIILIRNLQHNLKIISK